MPSHIWLLIAAAYLVVISLTAVCVTIHDKKIAIKNGAAEQLAKEAESKKKSAKSGSKASSASKNKAPAKKGSGAKKSTDQNSGGKKQGSNGTKNKKEEKAPTAYRRVPEKTLLILSALGGSIAMLITMRTIRHKTNKNKFMLGIPAIIVAQCVLVVALVLWL